MSEPRPSDDRPPSFTEGRTGRDPAPDDLDFDQNLDALFGPALAPFRRAVLAVSGGSDSMALMTLVGRWKASGRAPPDLDIDVATVDHGLRTGSAREADWVAERARALGFRHTTLVWSGEKPSARIQERAREARYALLAAHAGERPPAAVVTAHTADDQAETLVMRLGRGSGLDGLSAMAPQRPLMQDGSVVLVRPLLSMSKIFLATALKLAGGTWLDDPSNERIDFERVRLRAAQDHLAALGLSNGKLALSARRLLRAREALEQMAEAKLAELVDIHGGSFASLDRRRWDAEPVEIRLRLLARLLRAFGGDANPAQLSQIEALEAALAKGQPTAQTLGGCMVSQGRTTIRLYREPGDRIQAEVLLNPGDDVIWDWRFRIAYDAAASDELGASPVKVRPLGLAAYATLRNGLALRDRPPARAGAGLPSIWQGDRLVAVPSLPGASAPDGRFTARFVGLG